MDRYANLKGDSAVRRYEIAETSIIVEFANGHSYLYDYQLPGPELVEQMKERALAGEGLSTLISNRVRKRYARKLR